MDIKEPIWSPNCALLEVILVVESQMSILLLTDHISLVRMLRVLVGVAEDDEVLVLVGQDLADDQSLALMLIVLVGGI